MRCEAQAGVLSKSNRLSVYKVPWYMLGKAFVSAWSYQILAYECQEVPVRLFFLGSALVTWALLMCVAGRVESLCMKAWSLPLAGFSNTTGVALLFCAPLVWPLVGQWTLLLGAILCGVGFAFLYVMWFELLSRFQVAKVAVILCSELLLSQLIYYFVIGMDPGRQSVAELILMAATCIGLKRGLADSDIPKTRSSAYFDGRGNNVQVVKSLSILFICFLISVYCKESTGGGQGFLSFGYTMTPLLVLTSLLLAERVSLMRLYQLAMPTLTMCMLVLALLSDRASWICPVLADAAYSLILLYTRVLFCDACRRYGSKPLVLFSALNLVTYFANLIGLDFLYNLVEQTLGITPNKPIFVVVGCLMVIACSAIMVGTRGDSLMVTPPAGSEKALLYGKACDRLAERYGLTNREAEVMVLLVAKKTNSEIAAKLAVAQGTIKAHVHGVYAKIGVHSRDELIELVQDEAGES